MSWHKELHDFLLGLLTKQKVPGGVTFSMELGSGYDKDAEEAEQRAKIVSFCRAQLGKPYKLGSEITNPAEALAWDCSELTELAYKRAGLGLPDGAVYQFNFCRPSTARAGDLWFLWSDTRKMIGHVGIYTGEGTVVHAMAGRGVVEDPVSQWENHVRFRGTRRHPDFSQDT